MDFLTDFFKQNDQTIEDIVRKLDAKTVVFCALAMETEMIDRFRMLVPVYWLDATKIEMDKLKNQEYTRDDVILEVEHSLEKLKKEYESVRLRNLFKPRPAPPHDAP